MVARTHDRQRGQILVIFALSAVAIIAMVGLVIDGGSAFAQRRGQQNAADLAALAGADALLNGNDATTIAKNIATSNQYQDGTGGVSVTVTFPAGKVQVDIGAPHANSFARIFGMNTWQVSVTATALSGVADTAIGAAPVIMSIQDFGSNGQPLPQYTAAQCPVTGCIWGNGNGDTPNNATDWAWTLYGTNVNTSTVRDYLEGVGKLHGIAGCNGTPPSNKTIASDTNPYWGQHNNGMHNGAFNSANCITGIDVPVPIVGPPVSPATTCTGSAATDGCFRGWALFHVTGFVKHGNQSQWKGWFVSPMTQSPWLTVANCSGSSCPKLGPPQLNLTN
jgi:Flp pilus assembly protein TadG